jgi:hypothetical protein
LSSITPKDGWEDPPRQLQPTRPDLSQSTQDVYQAQTQPSQYSNSFLRCKVCDRGSLISRKLFRMSGPAVAIGFVLLIPSLLGMIFSALVLFGVIAYTEDESGTAVRQSRQPSQTSFDPSFRQTCAKNFKQSYELTAGVSPTLPIIEQYCECGLSVFKETGSLTTANQTCIQRFNDRMLDAPGRDVEALYSDSTMNHQKSDHAGMSWFRLIGSGFAVYSRDRVVRRRIAWMAAHHEKAGPSM